MRTVREILKESDPQEIADILLRLHLNTLFEQAEPEDTVADIRRLVGEWTKRIIFNILNAAPQKGGLALCIFRRSCGGGRFLVVWLRRDRGGNVRAKRDFAGRAESRIL